MKRASILAMLLVLAACAGHKPASLNRLERLDGSSLRIAVDNQNFSDAVVYAVSGGSRMRLGSVAGKDSKQFTFRWSASGLRLQVHFIGGRTFSSDQLSVYPGIDNNLFLTIGSGSTSRLQIGRRGQRMRWRNQQDEPLTPSGVSY